MANHHTVAIEGKRSKEQRDAWRERVQIGQLMEDLIACYNDPTRPKSANQIKCAEIVLDRFVPRLSATEITEVNELDSLSREEVLTRIQSLLQSDPTLLPELVGLEARKVHAEQVTSTVVQPKAGSAGG